MEVKYRYIVRTTTDTYLMDPVGIDEVRKQVREFAQQLNDNQVITQTQRNAINAKCRLVVDTYIKSYQEDDEYPANTSAKHKQWGLGWVNSKGQAIPFHKTYEYRKQWRADRLKGKTNE